ncbi:hypothetical protein ASPVEDRAFT_881857 [Aspergillus versicolor CBS 583.65]|uniref:Uncharacterized protein n=1 Tax=Aspergillus versicolor CBS 583.65 TaxID=1036611 RepID=A0A1L9PB94_ASPVE|nr:uncharacterized protein ASPVEDRAFT_881857 [Aspergillus versicolor CBS 583.65]OJI98799.1 hypothetical protein ASPVEDRAFT_881857 [Aspergillus versicolor CBS 583.65]
MAFANSAGVQEGGPGVRRSGGGASTWAVTVSRASAQASKQPSVLRALALIQPQILNRFKADPGSRRDREGESEDPHSHGSLLRPTGPLPSTQHRPGMNLGYSRRSCEKRKVSGRSAVAERNQASINGAVGRTIIDDHLSINMVNAYNAESSSATKYSNIAESARWCCCLASQYPLLAPQSSSLLRVS